MFLEKFNEPPKQIDLSYDSVDAVFSGVELKEWKDKEILEAYTVQIELSGDIYGAFLNKSYSLKELEGIDYFKMYVSAFADSADAKNLQKTKAYKNKSAAAQAAAYLESFYNYAFSVEREKLFYFSLVYRQTTVVITAPTDNKEQKEFLGYDWSNRKGNEGIQIITPGGKMYDYSNRSAEGTLANAVKKSFGGITPFFSDEQKKYGSVVNTRDMLDFSRVSFNKAIQLNSVRGRNGKVVFPCSLPLVNIVTLAEVTKGTSITKATVIEGQYKVIAGGKMPAYTYNQYNRSENVITVSSSGANAGYVNFWAEKIWASDCITIQSTNVITTKYIYYCLKYLQNQIIEVLQKGSALPHVYADDIKEIQLPDLSIPMQKKIVAQCSKIDKKYNTTRMTIENCRKKIDDLLDELDMLSNKGRYKLSLADRDSFDVFIGKRVLNKQLVPGGTVPVYSANVIDPFGHIDELLIKDFSVPSVLWGIDGDWMTNYIPAGKEFYPTDHCGYLRCKTSKVNPRYMVHILETEGKKLGFSRSYRASIDRICGITFTVPDRNIQDEAIAKIEAIEEKILEANKTLESLSGKTAEILNRFLTNTIQEEP